MAAKVAASLQALPKIQSQNHTKVAASQVPQKAPAAALLPRSLTVISLKENHQAVKRNPKRRKKDLKNQ